MGLPAVGHEHDGDICPGFYLANDGAPTTKGLVVLVGRKNQGWPV
jgi:hypothetical protein